MTGPRGQRKVLTVMERRQDQRKSCITTRRAGFVTGDEATEVLLAQIEASNPTDESVTADFSATLELDENKGDIRSRTEEQTIDPDSSQEFQVELLDINNIQADEFIGIYYLGFQMQISVNGETRAETCSDTEFSESNDQGCQSPFGIWETHVEVDYNGDWSGAAGGEGNVRNVSKQNTVLSETTDISYVNVPDDASIISANAQKQDNSTEELTIRIVHRDEVVAEQSTSSGYGVAQVTERI